MSIGQMKLGGAQRCVQRIPKIGAGGPLESGGAFRMGIDMQAVPLAYTHQTRKLTNLQLHHMHPHTQGIHTVSIRNGHIIGPVHGVGGDGVGNFRTTQPIRRIPGIGDIGGAGRRNTNLYEIALADGPVGQRVHGIGKHQQILAQSVTDITA